MGRTVLVTDHVFKDLETERELLARHDCELVLAPDSSEEALIEAADGIDAMLVCYASVGERLIAAAAAGGCRVISRYGIGYDNIDVDAATRHGVLVTYVPDYCLDEVADHTLALLLGLARGVVDADRSVRDGNWKVPQGTIHRLRGRRLSVLGAGGIGRRVIARAAPFGFNVGAYDPYLDPWDVDAERFETFENAVRDADAISLHMPLTDDNRHLIDRQAIAVMRRAPLLVNTSRGPLVDMDAAAEALESGALSGVALDVAEVEPPPSDHALRRHPRAILTPHMGFYSVDSQVELQRRAAEEIERALTGQPPDRPVNPEVFAAS